MATLDARSVVGLAGVAASDGQSDGQIDGQIDGQRDMARGEEGEEMGLLQSQHAEDHRVFRITAIKNRFS